MQTHSTSYTNRLTNAPLYALALFDDGSGNPTYYCVPCLSEQEAGHALLHFIGEGWQEEHIYVDTELRVDDRLTTYCDSHLANICAGLPWWGKDPAPGSLLGPSAPYREEYMRRRAEYQQHTGTAQKHGDGPYYALTPLPHGLAGLGPGQEVVLCMRFSSYGEVDALGKLLEGIDWPAPLFHMREQSEPTTTGETVFLTHDQSLLLLHEWLVRDTAAPPTRWHYDELVAICAMRDAASNRGLQA